MSFYPNQQQFSSQGNFNFAPPGPGGYPQNHQSQPPAGGFQSGYPPSQKPPSWYSQYYTQTPPQEMQALHAWFTNVDKNRSGSIDVNELQHITFDNRPIGLAIAGKLVCVFDQDLNGTIDFTEYVIMHKFIAHMRQAFVQADADRSGRIECHEIHSALHGAGFSYLTSNTIRQLLLRFDVTRRGLDYMEFLLMAAHIAHCRSLFEWNDKAKQGMVHLNPDQLTEISAALRA